MTETDLPTVIQNYLTASENRDADAVALAFTPDATVTDEGETHTGREEIRAWRQAVTAKYTYTTEITDVRHESTDTWIVSVRLTGDFPGHIADLDQRFTLNGPYITTLTNA